MGIGYRIKEAREHLGLTQTELGALIGVTGSAITNYEKETSHPKEQIIYKLMETLKVDANYLFQDVVKPQKEKENISFEEHEVIKKYRVLDNYGKETINIVLDREVKRVQEIEKLKKSPTITEFSEEINIPLRILQYFRSVSAGTGQVVFDDTYSERITIPDIPEYRRVAYAVKVNGHSMEPLYTDGDMLLIEPTCSIDIGEIGIFNVDGQAYVKKLGESELISLNTGYENIELTNDARCMGRVVDKFADNALD